MKKCPACDSTFEDSMRFCQVDGTPLVDDAPAFDPYATIVGRAVPVETPAEPIVESAPEKAADPEIHYTVGSIPIAEPEDVLDLPSNDPLKTMYVSESEMQAALSKEEAVPDIIEIPPIEEVSQPEPPSFIAPEPASPFSAPPPSPFSSDVVAEEPAAPTYEEPAPYVPAYEEPAPAPSYEPVAAPPVFEPEPQKFDEAATMIQPSFQSPFDQPPAPVAEWTPPPAPDASWQNQEIGSNTPFQPPVAGVEGQNKTLAIVSLVLGILGITICCGGLIPSIAAIVTGVMARNKANENPAEYGGASLATWGLITGIGGLVLGIIVIILQIMFGVMGSF